MEHVACKWDYVLLFCPFFPTHIASNSLLWCKILVSLLLWKTAHVYPLRPLHVGRPLHDGCVKELTGSKPVDNEEFFMSEKLLSRHVLSDRTRRHWKVPYPLSGSVDGPIKAAPVRSCNGWALRTYCQKRLGKAVPEVPQGDGASINDHNKSSSPQNDVLADGDSTWWLQLVMFQFFRLLL